MLKLLNDSGLTAATINRSLATLKVMLQEAVVYQYIPKNPAESIGVLKEDPKQKDILSPEEVRALFDERAIEKKRKGRSNTGERGLCGPLRRVQRPEVFIRVGGGLMCLRADYPFLHR